MSKIKEFLNEEPKKIAIKDILVIGTIIFLYGLLSFYKLGSTTNPNTFQDFIKGENLIINLKNTEDIIRMKVYNGSKNAQYEVYALNDSEYKLVTKITGKGSFSWENIRLLTKTKSLKFVFLADSSLGEIAIYNNSQKNIKINPYNSKKQLLSNLIDEQSLIPEQISYYNSTYFDEVYFARTAYEYTKDIPTYEWTHPPLGKLIQAFPIFITKKMTPFNYRLMGNIFGIFMIPTIYVFVKELFKKRKYAIFASLLLSLDTFHFTQTRMGTVDSYLVFFILLSFYFMYKYINSNLTKNLFLSGLFFAFSISVKWTGFYGGIALALIYFTNLVNKKIFNIKNLSKGFSFFVIIPCIFYMSLYLAFPNNKINYTNNLKSIINQQTAMYNYHSSVKSEHFFASKWYTWPVVYKPIWYHEEKPGNKKETIVAIGNIAIWWAGILSVLYLFYKAFIKKDKNSIFLLVIILSLWLPYSFIERDMFIYHYFPVTPFLIMSIVLAFKDLSEKFNNKLIIPLYLIIVFAFFAVYYPVISGKPISINYCDKLKLFDSWYF